MIEKVIRLKRSKFARNVATLLVGTASAQFISIAISPLLTRLYTPSEYGMFAMFAAFVSVMVPGITGRYEVALLLPKLKKQALALFSVAIWFGICAGLFALVAVVISEDYILRWLAAPELKGWILLAPFVVLITGYLNLMTHYANRNAQYSFMARATILQTVITALTSIVLGAIKVGFLGLLLGNVFGLLLGFLYLFYSERNEITKLNLQLNANKFAIAKKYKGFPLYNASMSIVNCATLAMPVFFLTNSFSPEIVGFYALIVRVLSAPLNFIAKSVSQVNMKTIVDLAHSDKNITIYLFKMAAGLFVFSLIPALVVGFFGQPLFAFIFGEEWRFAGYLAQIMAISLTIRFVASTLSPALGVTNKNHVGALWKIIAFISTLCVLLISTRNGSIEDVVIAIVINDFALYTLYFVFIVMATRGSRN